ncbi:MAG: hypothetical protein PVI30_02230 [Myxococcales bacterium]
MTTCGVAGAGCVAEGQETSGAQGNAGVMMAVPIPDEVAAGAAGSAGAAAVPEGTAELELLSDARLRLGFGDRTPVAARLTDLNGEPLAGEPVAFALMGRPQDASLTDVQLLTDADGEVENTLVAGELPATFQLRITAPGAGNTYVDVAISNAGFGTLEVDVPYEGARSVDERRIFVQPNAGCSGAERMPGDPMVTLDADGDAAPATFLALPAEPSYAVTALALSEEGTMLASGCVDQVKVTADETVTISLRFQDAPLQPEGRYVLAASLAAQGPAEQLADVIAGAIDAAVQGDAPDRPATLAEAYFLLDSLQNTLDGDAVTQTAGVDALSAALTETRAASSSLEESLRAKLVANQEGPLTAQAMLTAWIETRLADVGLEAALELQSDGDDTSARWVPLRMTLPGGDGPLLSVDLTEQPSDEMGAASFEPGSDRLTLRSLHAAVRFGALAGEALRRATSTGQYGMGDDLRTVAGCASLQQWLAEQSFDGSACDADCLEAACDRTIARLESAAVMALQEIDAARPTLRVDGDFELTDADGDLAVDALDAGQASGVWEPAGSGVATEDDEVAIDASASPDPGDGPMLSE